MIVKFLIFLIAFVGIAHGQVYFLGQGGYSQLNEKAASSNNVFPAGKTFGGGIGLRKDFYEFEASFLKFKGSAEIDHDGKKNVLVHEQQSLLMMFNFYFNKRFYARVGYGFHRINQELEEKVSKASAVGAKKAYDLREDEITDGVAYGAGFVLLDSKSFALYTQIENMNMSSLSGSAWNVSLGFKYYMD